ncbi:MAG TPA: ABC transporter substrate-binding protein [Acidimicrobiales bacterium]|nr:ABC transporter substrate-binding protein [Acidimicrobiales bacterium]
MRRSLIALAAVLALAAPAVASPPTSAAPASRPSCVVSLSPTATETLFAIGAGPQVQAVDTDSNYPTHGLPTKRINALEPSVEALIGVCHPTKSHPSTKPDLVVISYNANGIAQKLAGFGIKVVTQSAPSTLAGAYAQMLALGRLTGHRGAARALVSRLKAQVAAAVASVPAHPGKTLTVYYELDPTYYSLTSSTFVGAMLKRLGVVNIADAKNTSADAGYPQLSAEYVVHADPKLIFLADTKCCHQSAASVARRSGFSSVAAVRFHQVVGLDDDIASRWGPRVGILMSELAAGVRSALADARLWTR